MAMIDKSDLERIRNARRIEIAMYDGHGPSTNYRVFDLSDSRIRDKLIEFLVTNSFEENPDVHKTTEC